MVVRFWSHSYEIILCCLCVFMLNGCETEKSIVKSDDTFRVNPPSGNIPFAEPDVIKLHEKNLAQEYRIGPGDILQIEIWRKPELSAEHVVGPYGKITLPRLGEFEIGGKTRLESTKSITALYSAYYENPIVTIKILKFLNNKVYVLGRVSNPGMIHISGQATLLEALSMAGGLPLDGRSIFLSKCYIVRGRDQIIWIDLLNLLQNANTKLNIKLANNDIIYIPESTNEAVFVMGEVRNPGSYPIQTSGFSIIDAISLAGGPTENGKSSQVYIVRQLEGGSGVQRVINIEKMMTLGDFSENYLLQDNDIVYIPKKGIAKFNYYLRQIDPFMRTFISGMAIGQALDDNN